MDVFFFLQQGKEMYQTNPTQNHMGSDNWATRNPFSTILFSMHRPLPRTLLTLTHPRHQIASGSKYMYIGNSYRAVNGSFDFFLSLYRMQFTFYGSRLALTHREVNEIEIKVCKSLNSTFLFKFQMSQSCIANAKREIMKLEFTSVSITPL